MTPKHLMGMIDQFFADTTRSRQGTRQGLEEAREQIDSLLDCLNIDEDTEAEKQ